jgi:hypothetical protein
MVDNMAYDDDNSDGDNVHDDGNDLVLPLKFPLVD